MGLFYLLEFYNEMGQTPETATNAEREIYLNNQYILYQQPSLSTWNVQVGLSIGSRN